MTRPVPNTQSPLVDKQGKIVNPWNIWFQQFSQKAPKVVDVTASGSPYTSNNFGTVIITGASTISLTRGLITKVLTGQVVIPVSIGDIVAWTGGATVQFWET